MKNLLPIATIILLTGIISCQVDCYAPGITPSLPGYDSADLVLVTCSKYEKYNNFTTPTEKTYYSSTRGSGNSLISRNYGSDNQLPLALDNNYDYIIEIPATGKTYRITGITIGHGKTYNTNNGCTNAAKWYVNGSPFTSQQYEGGSSVNVLLSK